MSSKKPWRTVVTGDSTGRFTREEIREAVDTVASKSESRSIELKSGTHSRRNGRPVASGATEQAAANKGRAALVGRADKAASSAAAKPVVREKSKSASSNSVTGAGNAGSTASAKKGNTGKSRDSRNGA